MVFEDWYGIARILIGCVVAYVFVVLFLRVSGKRVLAKMNIFDLVITVAIGSTVATIVLDRDTPLAEGVVALGGLVALQTIASWISTRWKPFRRVLKSEPRQLFFQGKFNEAAILEERSNREEVLQAVRSSGIGSMEEVEAVVLETNGKYSVIKKSKIPSNTLTNVQ